MRFIVTVRRKQQQLEPMIWLVPPGHTATHIPAHTHTCMCCVFMLVEHVSVWAASVRLLLGAPANQSRCCRFSRTSKNDVMLCSEPLCVNSGWNIFTSIPTRQNALRGKSVDLCAKQHTGRQRRRCSLGVVSVSPHVRLSVQGNGGKRGRRVCGVGQRQNNIPPLQPCFLCIAWFFSTSHGSWEQVNVLPRVEVGGGKTHTHTHTCTVHTHTGVNRFRDCSRNTCFLCPCCVLLLAVFV